MTRREKNDLCERIKALHGYCKRRWNKDAQQWICVKCLVPVDGTALLKVAKKIIKEVDPCDYGEGELKNGSLEMLKSAVARAENR